MGHAGRSGLSALPERRSLDPCAKVFPRLSEVAVASTGSPQEAGRGRTWVSGLGSAAKRSRPFSFDAHHYPCIPSTGYNNFHLYRKKMLVRICLNLSHLKVLRSLIIANSVCNLKISFMLNIKSLNVLMRLKYST